MNKQWVYLVRIIGYATTAAVVLALYLYDITDLWATAPWLALYPVYITCGLGMTGLGSQRFPLPKRENRVHNIFTTVFIVAVLVRIVMVVV